MAMGRREKQARQEGLWVASSQLPVSAGHPFYQRLNRVLDENGFDRFAEAQCAGFYAARMGRPSITPGKYFRLLLVGYFEGIDSERGIAWRAADSLAIRRFVGVGLEEAAPDHSTISRTRRLLDVETHREVFTWVQVRLAEAGLLQAATVGVDATTLEANAALRSIVRRDTGEAYEEFLRKLAQASGIATPTREDLARVDRKRKHKGSNQDWVNPHEPDGRITKMKDGRTHIAHKAEHAVDLESGALLAVELHGADQGDTATLMPTLASAGEQMAAVVARAEVDRRAAEALVIREAVADKGYDSDAALERLEAAQVRSYISAKPGRRVWVGKPGARRRCHANRRRVRGQRGKRLLRQRGERIERGFSHVYDTGGMRRTHLRGHRNILKRLLIHAGGYNLGLLMRKLTGVGKPRRYQGLPNAAPAFFMALIDTGIASVQPQPGSAAESRRQPAPVRWFASHSLPSYARFPVATSATDC
ncbi:MAG: transposase [Terriglobales bacterium]